MTRTVRSCLLGGLICGVTLVAVAGECAGTPTSCGPAITIRVYDYSALPNSVTKRAQAEADRIFGKAGVKTEWAACPISKETLPGDPVCHESPSTTDIRLNILTAGMARKIATDHSAFGAAFPLKNGFGSLAIVFAERVRELAASHGAPEGLLLGHFISHEMGHLLLGLNSHSDAGIMRVPWSRGQIERAYLGTLLFAEHEAEQMQRHASARLEARTARPEVEQPRAVAATENTPRLAAGRRTHGSAESITENSSRRDRPSNAESNGISGVSPSAQPATAAIATAAGYR